MYLSDFFERNRTRYYEHLTKVREENNLTGWLKFFLEGVIATAESGVRTFDGILKLQKDVEEKTQQLGSRTRNAKLVSNLLFQQPIVDAQKVKEVTGLSFPSVYKILKE